MTPFDTYDLHFVKQLVNDLSQDNEVLQLSNQDLKFAFAFLQREHKNLQTQHQKLKTQLSDYQQMQQMLEQVRSERETAYAECGKLKNQIGHMDRLVRVAAEEQQVWLAENEGIIQELST